MRKLIIFCIMSILLLQAVSASDAFWACFNKGERIDYCNPKVMDRTCDTTSGCKMCMSSHDESANCWNQGNWNLCSTIPGAGCQTFGDGTSVDSIPPELTLVSPSPTNDSIFTSTRIPLKIEINEISNIYYLDNIYGRGRWVKLCTNCIGYDRIRAFKEGANDITFRASDVVGNTVYTNVRFFTDSKKPRFNRMEPRSGFASGEFKVDFTEANPKRLILNFGTPGNIEQKDVSLSTCIEGRSGKMSCETSADVSMFNGMEILYWFELEDIAGNIQESKRTGLKVDSIAPLIVPGSFEYTMSNTRVTFTMNITEVNFDEVTYIDHYDARPRERRFCSRLKDDVVCAGYKTFRPGDHNLTFTAYDDAGNTESVEAKFTIS